MNHKHDGKSCVICDGVATGKTRDEVVAEILGGMEAKITEHGVMVHAIDGQGTAPSFAYTTGMTEMGLPEVFMIGLPAQHAANGVYGYFHQIKAGALLPDTRTVTTLFNLPVEVVDVTGAEQFAALADLCSFTTDYYESKGKSVQWQQIVMSDREGLFPWEEGFDTDLMEHAQPLFGVPAAVEALFEAVDPATTVH